MDKYEKILEKRIEDAKKEFVLLKNEIKILDEKRNRNADDIIRRVVCLGNLRESEGEITAYEDALDEYRQLKAKEN